MPIRRLFGPLILVYLVNCSLFAGAQEKGGTVDPLKDRVEAHDEEALRASGYKTDGDSLLAFFRSAPCPRRSGLASKRWYASWATIAFRCAKTPVSN